MKRHGHILHRFSIKGRLENADPAIPDDKELEEVIAAKLLQEIVGTDGVKRYWLTHAGKTYLKSEKDMYEGNNPRSLLGLILMYPSVNTILMLIVFIVMTLWGLSWGVYEMITFFASIMDWFDTAIMSFADWMVDNFGGWIEMWL